jgi:hypothetical protein
MLALLLALSPGAVAMQASAPAAPAPTQTETDTAVSAQLQSDTVQSEPDGNTTTVMSLGTDPARAAFDSPSVALGSSLAMSRDGFRTQLSVNSLAQQLENADSVEKKKQILNRYRYYIENRIISLKATEQRTTQAFSNGVISEREYLRMLGQIDAESEQIRKVIESMQVRSEEISRFNLGTEASTLKGKLITIEGPVRDRVSNVLRGKADVTKIYVSTSDTGIILSTIDGDTYVREIVRQDRRDPSAATQLSFIETRDAVLENYPWIRDNIRGTDTSRYGSTNIFSVAATHQRGKLVAYIDGGTEKVFKEVQYKQLTGEHSIPPGPAVRNTTNTTLSENVTLAVNRTYPGGPLRVKLTNSTGAPLQGEVTVAGDRVGRTGPNGVLWTLGPAEQFRVSATYDDTTVNVTATSVESS